MEHFPLNEKIFVINLPSRTDRRQETQKELDRVGWRAEFFPAIRPYLAGGYPSIGARGCFLSHLAVLRKAQESRAPLILILEDDLSLTSTCAAHLQSAMASLKTKDWSIFYPGHVLESGEDGLAVLDGQLEVRCAHFMAVNGNAVDRLVEGLETIDSRPPGHALGGPMHVDGAYTTLRRQDPSLITYAYFPTLGYQRSSRSDIADLRWFDRVPALASLMSKARKTKRALARPHS